MTEYQKMNARFDKLMEMIKATAPHLRSFAMELEDSIKAAFAEKSASVKPLPPPVTAPLIKN